MAAAARKTALFHIGNRPSKTPEKMKAGKVVTKDSVLGAVSFPGSVVSEAMGGLVWYSGSSSSCPVLPEAEAGPVSEGVFGGAVIVFITARVSARLAAAAR